MPAPTGISFTRCSGSIRGASVVTVEAACAGATHGCAEVAGQRERDARARGGKDRGRLREPDRAGLENPRQEFVLALAQARALLLEQAIAGSPRQHQERDDAGQQQREPAAPDHLGGIGGDKDELDKQAFCRSSMVFWISSGE